MSDAANVDATNDGAVVDGAIACVQDTKRVAKDDSGVCCASLFKVCAGTATTGTSPCICSSVECGTAAKQPPPNVPCCPSVKTDCTTDANGDTQCKCG